MQKSIDFFTSEDWRAMSQNFYFWRVVSALDKSAALVVVSMMHCLTCTLKSAASRPLPVLCRTFPRSRLACGRTAATAFHGALKIFCNGCRLSLCKLTLMVEDLEPFGLTFLYQTERIPIQGHVSWLPSGISRTTFLLWNFILKVLKCCQSVNLSSVVLVVASILEFVIWSRKFFKHRNYVPQRLYNLEE